MQQSVCRFRIPYLCAMTLQDFYHGSVEQLKAIYDQSEAQALIKYLIHERLSLSFSEQIRQEQRQLTAAEQQLLSGDFERLLTGEPVQHVLGYAWFNDVKIKVNKHVLIPRPETEELVTFIQDMTLPEDAVIIDLCTGSGCIALALKAHFTSASVLGADVSEAALEVAEENSRLMELPVRFIRWDLLKDAPPDLPVADVIVANPPYVRMEEIEDMHLNVANFEPHIALFVPDDDPLLFYRVIAAFALKQLKPGGRVWFEINRVYGDATGELLEEMGFEDIRVYQDLAESDRFVSALRPSV